MIIEKEYGPAHWASGLVNNDWSGTEPDEKVKALAWSKQFGSCLTANTDEGEVTMRFEGLLTSCIEYHFDASRWYGKLARQAGREARLQVLRSNAGYYIGTLGEEGEPYTRESVEYWRDEAGAAAALDAGSWTQKTQL